jgi:hypothetical protein
MAESWNGCESEGVVLPLRVLTEQLLKETDEDDEKLLIDGLVKGSRGQVDGQSGQNTNIVPSTLITIRSTEKIETVLKDSRVLKGDVYYLRIWLVNGPMSRFIRFITLPRKGLLCASIEKACKEHMMVWMDEQDSSIQDLTLDLLLRNNHIELVAKPVPPGVRALACDIHRSGLSHDAAKIIPLGEHFLYRSNPMGWVKRFLAIGTGNSYPLSFSTLRDTELLGGILYLFDDEYMMDPLVALPLHTIHQVKQESNMIFNTLNHTQNIDIHAISSNLSSLVVTPLYYWVIYIESKDSIGPRHLSFKCSDFNRVQTTLKILKEMRYRTQDIPIPKKDSIKDAPKGSVLFLDVICWYIEYTIKLLETSKQNEHLTTHGIFRIVGRLNIIDQIYNKICIPGSIPGDDDVIGELSQLRTHDLAGLLKKFVREYPGRLVSRSETEWLLAPIISKADKSAPTDRILSIFGPSCPFFNSNNLNDQQRRRALVNLIQFLHRVSRFAVDANGTNGGNGMNVHNLAIVFAPNIFDFHHYDALLLQEPSSTHKGGTKSAKTISKDQVPLILNQMTQMVEFLIVNCSVIPKCT